MFCYPDVEHLQEQFHYMVYALLVDKWEVLLLTTPHLSYSACATCSPQSLVIAFLGDPMTHSLAIFMQT
jgi:hypothetical protein